MRLDLNGFPVISHYDPANGDLRLTRCYDPSCVVAHSNIVDDGGVTLDFVGQYPSLRLDSNDIPVISYYNETTGVLNLAHCEDLDCAEPATINTVDDTGNTGHVHLARPRPSRQPGHQLLRRRQRRPARLPCATTTIALMATTR